MPSRRKRRKPLRQFQCETEGCKVKGRTWLKRETECECRECDNQARLIPEGEEIGPFIFEFECKCSNKYTVWCRWEDTAPCYACREKDNAPVRFIPRQFIDKKTNNRHSCSRCRGKNSCPNLSRSMRR